MTTATSTTATFTAVQSEEHLNWYVRMRCFPRSLAVPAVLAVLAAPPALAVLVVLVVWCTFSVTHPVCLTLTDTPAAVQDQGGIHKGRAEGRQGDTVANHPC